MSVERSAATSPAWLGTVGVMTLALAMALSPASPLGLWLGTTVAGALGIGAAWWSDAGRLRAQWRGGARQVLQGVAAGAAMGAATHWVYPWVAEAMPALQREAVALYARLDAPPGRIAALPMLAWVVVAEEIVWRGVAYVRLRERFGGRVAWALASCAYVLPQLGSGSWLLVTLAAVFGAIWTGQRAITGGLLVGTVTHLTWNLLVIVAFPLES